MRNIAYIRTEVFRLSQREFGLLAGATQGTVSRWEKAELEPSLEHLKRIRSEARRHRVPWNDAWFFEPPFGDESFVAAGSPPEVAAP